mmetsp:Transcript_25603/g.46474  ORF Transcript_25603/g.46474 Transcript_25603/m.46474 type:complete len:210 (-) Transcript_25603:217-846(-)
MEAAFCEASWVQMQTLQWRQPPKATGGCLQLLASDERGPRLMMQNWASKEAQPSQKQAKSLDGGAFLKISRRKKERPAKGLQMEPGGMEAALAQTGTDCSMGWKEVPGSPLATTSTMASSSMEGVICPTTMMTCLTWSAQCSPRFLPRTAKDLLRPTRMFRRGRLLAALSSTLTRAWWTLHHTGRSMASWAISTSLAMLMRGWKHGVKS